MQGYAYIIEVLVFWRYNPISWWINETENGFANNNSINRNIYKNKSCNYMDNGHVFNVETKEEKRED